MHHYEPKTRETIFSFRGEKTRKSTCVQTFPAPGQCGYRWNGVMQWQVGVALPAGCMPTSLKLMANGDVTGVFREP